MSPQPPPSQNEALNISFRSMSVGSFVGTYLLGFIFFTETVHNSNQTSSKLFQFAQQLQLNLNRKRLGNHT